jgi:hypothetical protein
MNLFARSEWKNTNIPHNHIPPQTLSAGIFYIFKKNLFRMRNVENFEKNQTYLKCFAICVIFIEAGG